MSSKQAFSDGNVWAQESPETRGFKLVNRLFRPYNVCGMLFIELPALAGQVGGLPKALLNHFQRFRSGVARLIPALAGLHGVFEDRRHQFYPYGLSILCGFNALAAIQLSKREQKKRVTSVGVCFGVEPPTADGNYSLLKLDGSNSALISCNLNY